LTGASGFFGREIENTLRERNLSYTTIGRSAGNQIQCDLLDSIPPLPALDKIIHAAGRAHVIPKTDEERKKFFDVNVTGTRNLLTALERQSPVIENFIFISSVSVYGVERGDNIPETHALSAQDAYGMSKIAAEKAIRDWCSVRNISFYILRLPLIAGANPPGNLKAMIQGIRSGKYKRIGKGDAKKSVVLANDVANFIVSINGPSGEYNLTDGYHPSFAELERKIAKAIGRPHPSSIPYSLARLLGWAGDLAGSRFPVNSDRIKKITSTLTFDDSNARKKLAWQPRQVLKVWEIQ
jgi:nucleoside-diphosphate-sugar epimerase